MGRRRMEELAEVAETRDIALLVLESALKDLAEEITAG